MYAMDMYRVATSSLAPAPAPGLTASGWTTVAYITGEDSLFPNTNQTVCYGYLARQASGEMVAVIRGTDRFVEWVEDAMFAPIPYAPQIALPAGSGALEVEQGFWTLYKSMQLIDPAGVPLGALAPTIASAAGAAGTVTVVGHSLGAALATYLTLDLARRPWDACVSLPFRITAHGKPSLC